MQQNDSFRLVIRRGPQPNQAFEVRNDVTTLGRDISNDIVINDRETSRHHLRLMLSGDTLTIEDLGSTNGTFVNGKRVSGVTPLQNGDMVGLGETVTLALESVAAGAEPPPSPPPTWAICCRQPSRLRPRRPCRIRKRSRRPNRPLLLPRRLRIARHATDAGRSLCPQYAQSGRAKRHSSRPLTRLIPKAPPHSSRRPAIIRSNRRRPATNRCHRRRPKATPAMTTIPTPCAKRAADVSLADPRLLRLLHPRLRLLRRHRPNPH